MHGSVNMTKAVVNYGQTSSSFGQVRIYGAGATEAADERLVEQVRAQRLASNKAKADQVTMANKKADRESASGIQEEIAELRRRQFLEDELKQNKAAEAILLRKAERASVVVKKVSGLERVKEDRERKRKAAFEQKKKEAGAKPAGVAKVVTPKKSPQKAPAAWVRKYGKGL